MSFQIENYTIGSDFEMSIRQQYSRNLISSIGIIGGTKAEPLSIDNGCFRQEDGIAAEFNIPPVNNVIDWTNYIKYCIKTVNDNILYPLGLCLAPLSSAEYPDSQLTDPKAREFGCSVSYDAYSEKPCKKPSAKATNLRTMGFHVHVGFKGDVFESDELYRFIKTMDLFLGVPSILIDKDTARREMYGKAGEHRIKYSYDFDTEKFLFIPEYRVLGGNLLADDELIIWTYNQTIAAIKAYNEGLELPGMIVRDCINNHLEATANNLCKEYGIKVPDIQVNTEHLIVKTPHKTTV